MAFLSVAERCDAWGSAVYWPGEGVDLNRAVYHGSPEARDAVRVEAKRPRGSNVAGDAGSAANRAAGSRGQDGRLPKLPSDEGELAFVLKEEPDLADGLSPSDRRAAVAAFRARVITVGRPRWEPPELDPATTYGLLVLEGLIGRRVRIGPAVGTELLSCGDILRPWDEPTLWGMIPPELDWRVFRPTRLAVLDEQITTLIGRRPQLVVNFSSRILRRARSVAYIMAISHHTRVEDKLLVTLAPGQQLRARHLRGGGHSV